MKDRPEQKSTPQPTETEKVRTWRHFKHYYGAPIIIAFGIFIGGGSLYLKQVEL